MSYHLNKDEEKGYTEEWIPYKPMVFEKEDMTLRQTQLQIRVGECQKTLDLLHALNNGVAIDHLIHSTIDLLNFKVCKRLHYYLSVYFIHFSYSTKTLSTYYYCRV
jgi:hypothetical protein